MLAACGPLLLPTGFCTCKAGAADRVTHSGEKASTPAHTEIASSHKTGCCSKHHSAPGVAKSVPAPPDEPRQAPGPIPHDDHSPGCPAASPVADRPHGSDPSPERTDIADAAPLAGGRLAPSTTARRATPVVGRNWPCSPPLYLSHCALVI